MGRPSSIPEHVEGDILKWHGERLSTRAISAKLKDVHKLEIGYQAVNRFVNEYRQQRADVLKDQIRDKLEPQVLSDIEVLAEQQKRLRDFVEKKHAQVMSPDVNPLVAASAGDLYLKGERELRQLTDTKLRYSGAGASTETGGGGVVVLGEEIEPE